jgi:hypothetical protein
MGPFMLLPGRQLTALGVGYWLQRNHYALQAKQVGSIDAFPLLAP